MNNKINNKEKGKIGEEVACKFLMKRGYKIIKRNYLKKWGEIDIIAEKDRVIHFFEVKSVVGEKAKDESGDGWNQSENIHSKKKLRLKKAIGTYLAENRIEESVEYIVDAALVWLNMEKKVGKVEIIPDILL